MIASTSAVQIAKKEPLELLEKLSPSWLKAQKAPSPMPSTAVKARPRVAVYLRYSTDKQDPYSFERQLKKAHEYAALIGGDIVLVFGDAGESGAYVANRPGFQDMLKAARRREFDILLIEDGDRLARRLHITATAFAQLAECRIELHSSKAGKWSLMHAAFAGLISEEQRARIAELMRSGIVKIVSKGRWPAKAPYGFEKIPGQPGEMRKVEREIKNIHRMFKLRLAGLSIQKIADVLYDDGVLTREGKPFSEETIRRILGNPIYIGVVIYFRTILTRQEIGDEIKSTREKRPVNEWIYSERKEWSIFDTLDDWQEVQRLNALGHPTGPNGQYLLSRKVVCGNCGSPMISSGGRMSGGRMKCTRYYKIKRRKLKLPPCHHYVLLPFLEREVIALVCAKLERPDALECMQAGYTAKVQAEAKTCNVKRNEREAERAAIHKRLDATYDAAIVAGHTTKVVVEQRKRWCARIEEIDRELASIPTVNLAAEAFKGVALDARSFLTELKPGRIYHDCTESLAVLRSSFRRLIDEVVITTTKSPSKRCTSKTVRIELKGPIADIDGGASKELAYVARVEARTHRADLAVEAGTFLLSDNDWEKLRRRLPFEEVWVDSLREPLHMRDLLNAAILMRRLHIRSDNIPDIFGPPSLVWAALRRLEFSHVLDFVAEQARAENIELLSGVRLSFHPNPMHRSKSKNPIQKFAYCNEVRRGRVLARQSICKTRLSRN